MSVTVSQINIFPIKSCRGTSLQSSAMTLRGFKFDRKWMVVNEEGNFLTQRQFPTMSQILPEINSQQRNAGESTEEVELSTAGAITKQTAELAASIEPIRMQLTAPGMPAHILQSSPAGTVRKVVVWNDSCEATDEGDEVARWFSEYLKTNCRLVRFGEEFVRPVDSKYAKSQNDQVGFADGFPFLLISENSLQDLNEKMSQALPMNRFRPNIVVSGCEPYAEDNWKTLIIGGARLQIVKPCARCVITCTDQDTSKVGVEPLRTLSKFRNDMNKILFGQNLVPEKLNAIKVGDLVEVVL
jgi:uncharacterized protein YcbX